MTGLPVPPSKRHRVLLRQAHRISAIVLGTYAVPHVFSHLFALVSAERHIEVMTAMRQLYRQPLLEGVLLAAVLVQIVTGTLQLWQGRGQRVALFTRLQRWAGLILAIFLAQHVSAVLLGRLVQGVDTNLYFAAAVVLKLPHAFYFAPYYLAGVLALFVHLGAAMRPAVARRFGRRRADQLAGAMGGIGLGVGLAILMALTGLLYPIQLPGGY